jgi:thiosulfate dehydrogenase
MMMMKSNQQKSYHVPKLISAVACAVAFLIGVPSLNPASAVQIQQEKDVLSGKEHEFGDAFIVSLGGKLYDDYWAGSASSAPARRNPSFPDDLKVSNTDSWRCGSCHGWDYDGAEKAPDSKQQSKQFASLRHLQGTDPFRVTELFTRSHPDHPAQSARGLPLDLLILFLTVGQYRMETLALNKTVAPEYLSRGQDIFEGVCMSCHDPDGKSGLRPGPGLQQSLGWLARNKPKQTLHKILNGVPGESMLALRFIDEAVVSDLLAYLRTLDQDAR